MTRLERLAMEAILDAEDRKEIARRQAGRAYRDYRDACDMQNRVCDMMGVRRINDSFERIEPVYADRLDRAYARRCGEVYDDGLDDGLSFSRVVNTLGQLAGAGRKILNDNSRW